MKILGLLTFTLTLIAGSNAWAGASANSAKGAWVAQLTEETQCETGVKAASLGEAVQELEKTHHVSVRQALIARLGDRAFCAACHCPEGSYYVARIQGVDEKKLQELEINDWEIVHPGEIIEEETGFDLPTGEEDRGFRVLPVVPTY